MFKRTIAGALAATALLTAAPAGADIGYIEQDFADRYWLDICDAMDTYHNSNGVAALVLKIMDIEGFSGPSALDVVAYTASEYCPRNLPLLRRFADDYEKQYNQNARKMA